MSGVNQHEFFVCGLQLTTQKMSLKCLMVFSTLTWFYMYPPILWNLVQHKILGLISECFVLKSVSVEIKTYLSLMFL